MEVLILFILIALLVSRAAGRPSVERIRGLLRLREKRDAPPLGSRLLPAPPGEPAQGQQPLSQQPLLAGTMGPVEARTGERTEPLTIPRAPSAVPHSTPRCTSPAPLPTIRINQCEERKARIREIVEERGIQRLVHFTPVVNIESVLRHGLFSQRQLKERKIAFMVVDPLRLDERLDFISLSISRPNSAMLRRKDIEKKDVEDWVIVDLHPRLLWELDCLFAPTNAASRSVRSRKDEELRTPEALAALFEGPRPPDLPPECPTDQQAEVLVRDHVPPSYITAVRVRNTCDPDPNHPTSLAARLRSASLEGIRIIYFPSDFGDRRDSNRKR